MIYIYDIYIYISLLVNSSHTDEFWEGRNTCMWIYIYIYVNIYIIYMYIYINTYILYINI